MWSREVTGIIRTSFVLLFVVNSLVTELTAKSTTPRLQKNGNQLIKDLPKKERVKYENLLKKAVEDHRMQIMTATYKEREKGKEALLESTKNKETVMGFYSKYFFCFLHFHVSKKGKVHTVKGFTKNLCVPIFDKSDHASTIALYQKQLNAYKHVGAIVTKKTSR
ncbi:hypothetical protein GE061_004324 [Apolygus lucorum]|uniref:Uncharacterized protein n=1 Tax=Apolygus lucorum TaxID=248454 RepID=A0A6A4IYG3_APOLU|nr:hypothetical protein GE061_004324 [Apolygus lucorum]